MAIFSGLSVEVRYELNDASIVQEFDTDTVFGVALGAGDFDGTHTDDLVFGDPWGEFWSANASTNDSNGAVRIAYSH